MAWADKISRYWQWAKQAKDIIQYLIWLSTLIGGAGLMVYLGSITSWAVWLGPLGGALIAIGAMLLVSVAYYLWTLATTQRSMEAFAKAKIESKGISVLAPSHDHERINMADFYHPFFFATENVRFTDCELLGPATVAIFEGCTFQDGGFIDCEIVIVRSDRPIKGVSAFRHCSFLRGRLIRITLMMNFQQYQALPDIIKRGTPVISDGTIGDI